MTEELWFILVLWIIMLILGLRFTETAIGAVAGIIGIFFGLMLFTAIGAWIGLLMIFFNFYVIYKTLFPSEEGEEE